MVTVEAEVGLGIRTNRKWTRAWDYRDESSYGDGGRGCEMGEEDMLSVDERKCSRIGHGGTGAR